MSDELITDCELRALVVILLCRRRIISALYGGYMYMCTIYVCKFNIFYTMNRRCVAPGPAGRKRSQIDTRVESIVRFARICRRALLTRELWACERAPPPFALTFISLLYSCLLYPICTVDLTTFCEFLCRISFFIIYNDTYMYNIYLLHISEKIIWNITIWDGRIKYK